jgi:hypothetical protein
VVEGGVPSPRQQPKRHVSPCGFVFDSNNIFLKFINDDDDNNNNNNNNNNF